MKVEVRACRLGTGLGGPEAPRHGVPRRAASGGARDARAGTSAFR